MLGGQTARDAQGTPVPEAAAGGHEEGSAGARVLHGGDDPRPSGASGASLHRDGAHPLGGVPNRRWLAVLALLLLALNLARLLAFRFFPSEDGPIHLEIAMVLGELWRGGEGGVADYFRLNPSPQPNWLVYLALTPLARMFGPLAAEKALLAGYVVLLPVSLVYALGALRREGLFWALLAFPLTFNYLAHLGFYNFSYSLALMLFTLGYWLRRREGLRGRATFGLALLLLATGVAHPVTLGSLLVTLGVLTVWSVGQERLAAAGTGGASLSAAGWLARVARRLWPLCLAALPPVALSAVLFTGPTAGEPAYRMPLVSLVKVLAMLHSLVSYDRREIALAVATGALLGGAAVAVWVARRRLAAVPDRGQPGAPVALPTPRRVTIAWSDGLLLAIAALLVLYFVVPTGFAGGGFFSQRLQLHMLLLAILWLADQPASVALRRTVVTGTVALSLGWAALHFAAYARLDRLLAEYVSLAPHLPPGSTVLSLSFVEEDDRPTAPGAVLKVQPFMHAAGYLAAERNLVDLGCYQADRGYFPILYRDAVNPYRHLASDGDLESAAGLDLLAYEETGGRVDHVVLWGLWGERRERPDVRPLLRQLERGYERIAVTGPVGVGELHRRRAEL
jgi:hypothetical protein